MTDHEIFTKEMHEHWAEQRRLNAELFRLNAQEAEARREQREDGKKLDDRINKLVSVLGEFFRREK